jgi:hypothetical protein
MKIMTTVDTGPEMIRRVAADVEELSTMMMKTAILNKERAVDADVAGLAPALTQRELLSK